MLYRRMYRAKIATKEELFVFYFLGLCYYPQNCRLMLNCGVVITKGCSKQALNGVKFIVEGGESSISRG